MCIVIRACNTRNINYTISLLSVGERIQGMHAATNDPLPLLLYVGVGASAVMVSTEMMVSSINRRGCALQLQSPLCQVHVHVAIGLI